MSRPSEVRAVNGIVNLTIIELTMWPCVRACARARACMCQPIPKTADATVTKIAGYVHVRILMNREP